MALPGIEMGILRAAGKAIGWITPKARTVHQRRHLREHARALTPLTVGATTLDELDGDRHAKLAAFINTPDFEQLALQLTIAGTQPNAVRDEIVAAVQTELWHGLRRALDVKEDLLYRLREVVFDALIIAISTTGEAESTTLRLGTIAHLATAATRNGELLGRIGGLGEFHRLATLLRRQVAQAHADIRLPHTGVNRAVPWAQLYVDPILSSDDDGFSRDDLFVPGTRTVILGDPGAGKSTLTEKLAHDVAASPDDARVPFRVVLRDLSELLRADRTRLSEHLSRVAAEPYNVALSPDAVEYLLLNGRAVVILDGLDELTEVALRVRLVRLVESFANMYPTVPIVVTSRKIGYRDAPLHPQVFKTAEIAAMDANRVSRYAGNWFALDESMASDERHRLHSAFMTESRSIHDLRTNPLMLSLLCATYSAEGYIPRNRTQVYERCALLVFERWDQMRGIGSSQRFRGHVRGAVQELAWRLLTERDTAEATRTDAGKILVEHLRTKGFDSDQADATSEGFLDFCAGRAWVLAEIGSTPVEPIYGFAHRTFLEYFAAEHLVRHNPEPTDLWTILQPHIADGEWEVVAQLALQLLDRNRHDGTDAVIALILDNRKPDGHHLSFLSRASAELVFSPKALRQLTDAAVDHALATPQCPPVFWDTEPPSDTVVANEAIVSLLVDSLAENQAHALPRFKARLSELVSSGESLAPAIYAVYGEPQADDHPLLSIYDNSHIFELRHGPAPIYQWVTAVPYRQAPLAQRLVAEPGPYEDTTPELDAHGLARRLMKLKVPWLPASQWWRDFNAANETSDAPNFPEFSPTSTPRDLGPRLVIGLPYLETHGSIFDADSAVDLPQLAVVLLTMRKLNERYVTGDIPLPPHSLPPDILDFLLRWARHEFSVIG